MSLDEGKNIHDTAGEKVSELQDRLTGTVQAQADRGKRIKKKQTS